MVCALNPDRMKKPEPLKEVNLVELRRICQEYLDFVDNDEEYHEDHDYDQYIFERAVMTFFGEGVFDWINRRQE